uniref:Regulatory protein zeste n=1 Tax=Daphnia galeata TaxID=27404 RepID=A0A8J2RMZ7_9CRUS|nr:unnamed protein product [Daphnia galeata]
MSRDKAQKRQRDIWVEKETYTLLENFIIYKSVLNGAYSSSVTKERKNSIWREITAIVHNEHPDCTEKTQEQVEKKWKNFIAAARVAIRNYNNGLTETGGGPLGEGGILRPIYQKYYEEVLGLDNPAVSATAIPGGIDTEDISTLTGNVAAQQQLVERIVGRSDNHDEEDHLNENFDDTSMTSVVAAVTDNRNLSREPEECELHFTLETSNSPGSSLSTTPTPVTGMLAIEGSELITANSTIDKGKILVGSASVARRLIYNSSSPTIRVQGGQTTPSPSSESQFPSTSSAFSVLKQKRDSLTLRQTMKKTKYSLCDLGESTAQSRLTEQRLKVLSAVMDVREKLKNPVLRDELPEDLIDLLYNLKENV